MQAESSAWHTDSPAWMKQRKEAWKRVKPRIDKLYFVKKKEAKFLKDFFLTGTVDLEELQEHYWGRANPERPLQAIEAVVLLECWLSPDHSEANWRRIKEKYRDRERAWSDAQRRFLEIAGRLPGGYVEDGESFFSGLEERLYRFLLPTRCRREDYPGLSDADYQGQAELCAGLSGAFREYLNQDPPNPYNITRFRVSEWRDGRIETQRLFELLDEAGFVSTDAALVQCVDRILARPANYDPLHIQFARELAEALDDPGLSPAVRESIAAIREQVPSLEQRMMPGAWATFYIICRDAAVRERLFRFLPPEGRPHPDDVPHEDQDLLLNIWGFRKPRSLSKDGDRAFWLEARLGPEGDRDVGLLYYIVIPDGAVGLYAHFDTPEGEGAYFRIEEEGKAACIYRHGQDAAVDAALAAFDQPAARLKWVAERFG